VLIAFTFLKTCQEAEPLTATLDMPVDGDIAGEKPGASESKGPILKMSSRATDEEKSLRWIPLTAIIEGSLMPVEPCQGGSEACFK